MIDHVDDKRAGRLRLLAVLLAGLGLLWLGMASAAYSSENSAGAVEVPGDREFWSYDYKAYLNAAERLEATGSPYQDETLSGPYRPGPFGLYMYSPTLSVGLLPAVGHDFEVSATAWYWLHVLALVAACALMPVSLTIRLFAFAAAAFSFAVIRDMGLGNISVMLLLPMSMAWRWLDRPLGSVAQAVAMSVRPTLGILLIWQLLRRRWKAVAWTVGAGLVLIALTLPFVGIAGYTDYLSVLRNMSEVTGVPYNHDLSSVMLDLGADDMGGTIALLAGYVFAMGAMLVSLRRDREVGYMVTLTGSLLLSPLLWDHYLAMLVLPGAFLASRGRPLGLLLPMAAWLPMVVEEWTFLYPLVVVVATLLPFSARDARPEPGSTPSPAAQAIAA